MKIHVVKAVFPKTGERYVVYCAECERKMEVYSTLDGLTSDLHRTITGGIPAAKPDERIHISFELFADIDCTNMAKGPPIRFALLSLEEQNTFWEMFSQIKYI